MAINVNVPAASVVTKVSVPSASTRITTITRTPGSQALTNAKLENLANVDPTAILEDGDTLVYDITLQKWVPTALTAITGNVDGGTY
jgi:hypothetical protein